MQNCLLCGSGVWYVGLFNADCTNSGCTNFREPPGHQGQSSGYGSWDWAVNGQKVGWKLEFNRDGTGPVWHELYSTLQGEPRTDFEFRLNQAYYSPSSQYARGTKEWADDLRSRGFNVRRGRHEFEIMVA